MDASKRVVCIVSRNQGRNEGGQGVQYPGNRITMGAPNHCGGRRMTVRGADKSQQCRKYFFQYNTFTSERPQFRTWGRQTCFLARAPSNLVTPLAATELWLIVKTLVFETSNLVLSRDFASLCLWFLRCFFSNKALPNFEGLLFACKSLAKRLAYFYLNCRYKYNRVTLNPID